MTSTSESESISELNSNNALFLDRAYMESLRLQMLKFAQLQVQDQQLAEDAVQEAMLSAYLHIDKFQRQAALKTWIFSILKNKLIDLLRKEKRLTVASQLEDGKGTNGEALIEQLFNQNGHWHKHEAPVKWAQPDNGIENEHFWRVFDACLTALPARYGRLFMMREFLELESDEIVSNEEITVSHLNVTLYRARLRLRECLENNWFSSKEDTTC